MRRRDDELEDMRRMLADWGLVNPNRNGRSEDGCRVEDVAESVVNHGDGAVRDLRGRLNPSGTCLRT